MNASRTVPDVRLVDLNLASRSQLDELGARLSRAIVAGRPYRSPDELLTRRILSRETYRQIKDRVAVR